VERLVGCRAEVDDRQPTEAELGGHPVVLVVPAACGVRSAVSDPLRHDVNQLGAIRLLVTPRDPTHGQTPAWSGSSALADRKSWPPGTTALACSFT
jgi:hypothetical protein